MNDAWPLLPSVGALVVSVAVLAFAGTRLAWVADDIAERTGMGKATAGALLLGGVTSLTGIVTTATGALAGEADFALANPLGGVAIQSVWIAIADLMYRRANLEHAAASLPNLLQSMVLVALLSLPIIAYATPQVAWGWFHPLTLAIPAFYFYGLRLLKSVEKEPQWRPRESKTTGDEQGEPPSTASMKRLWLLFAGLGVVVAATGWVVARAGLGLVDATGMPSGVAGFTITTAISSLPELITLIAAVRMGSITMGVGNIIGGNVFDTLMIAVADLFFVKGSIYAHVGPTSIVLLGGTILISAVLALGLVVRDTRGIGFEGFAIPAIYLGTVAFAIAAS
ncbi:hypothetical protein LGT39_02995 [Demequina sp. TTPB684]|uniref:sodium:calcium antiporter n=1 Tax=unclassified Demequina TaxID=2620311 RepID=UPI001CF22741|nr:MULTISPECIES: hypothetical protein [unclassified Demequina]MCB2411816.1 hypothetical protein [Demequina sp. TTPB684]UPU88831.1 hypothetical protein LGT36_002625 [Demequina sp. TMPB413]